MIKTIKFDVDGKNHRIDVQRTHDVWKVDAYWDGEDRDWRLGDIVKDPIITRCGLEWRKRKHGGMGKMEDVENSALYEEFYLIADIPNPCKHCF